MASRPILGVGDRKGQVSYDAGASWVPAPAADPDHPLAAVFAAIGDTIAAATTAAAAPVPGRPSIPVR